MTQAINILERPAQSQWDSDSYCQKSNCRCTSEAMIAGFYKDLHISPDHMREAMGYRDCGGTDAPHGAKGLEHYGIPASWGQLTKDQVISKVGQNIPLDIAVVYGKIPRNTKYIQDMNFYGLHSVVACKRVGIGGVYGLYIRDPDRWYTGKVEFVFWPDNIWIPAFAAANYVAVWPDKAKIITLPSSSWHVEIDANASVEIATLGAKGCISSWTIEMWGNNASSAESLAPVTRVWCTNAASTARTVYVTSGKYAGRHIKIDTGVKAIKI